MCRPLASRPTAVLLLGSAVLAMGCDPPPTGDPINVSPQVFFNQVCPRSHVVYTVPTGKRLVITDVNASASSAADDPPNQPHVPVHLSIRTNPTGVIPWGSADHWIVFDQGLPAGGGRVVTAYAETGTDVLFGIGGCNVPINVDMSFSGLLVDFP